MFKKTATLFAISSLIFNIVCESAFARAGGRSSFGGSGRSSTSYSNQGSRGSRSYEGGGAGGKNYSGMQKSTTQNDSAGSGAAQRNGQQGQNTARGQEQNAAQQPNRASSFFQRNPMLSMFGAAIAGSWIGHMLFGGSGLGGAGGAAGAGGGMLINILLMALGAFAVVMLVRFLNRQSNTPSFNQAMSQGNNSRVLPMVSEINLSENEKQKFSEILVEVQSAWSNQDLEKLKKLTTPEMLKYFSDNLSQNISQDIANKVENVEVISLQLSESWREDEMEYATAILEWSAFDYMFNLNKKPSDTDYIIEGSDKNLIITSEAWTFARYNSNGRWILSAIAQVE